MTAESFILWLNGFLEACANAPTAEQMALIQTKLDEVQLRGPFRNRPRSPTAG